MKLPLVAVAALSCALIASAQTVPAQNIIRIDGSSTVFPITKTAAEEFERVKRGPAKITIHVSGTGGGFKKFCRGETDINNASRPILKQEMEACRKAGVQYYELPVAFGALTVVVNRKNSWASSMSLADLKKIWEPAAQGKVTRWRQVRSNWPNAALKLFAPGADSGTFDYFTEAVVGRAKASRSDFTASEDDNVLVTAIAADRNALGYFGFVYYLENQKDLKAIAVDAGRGPVLPSSRTVENGTYQPLSRTIFIYVSRKGAERPEIKEFTQFYLQNAISLAQQVRYVVLPTTVYAFALQQFRTGKLGTLFGGAAKTGARIKDLLAMEAQL